MAKLTTHPKLTPERIAELSALAEKIDREEKDEIIAMGREVFARRDRIRQVIANMKAAREAKGLSLDDVAARTGIDKPNLSRLENFRVPAPRLDTLLKIADAVGYKLLA
jgi:DNA-binding Xre family transcriptional regulator